MVLTKKYLLAKAVYQLENVAKNPSNFDVDGFYIVLKEELRLLYNKLKTPVEHKHMISMIHDGLENTLIPLNKLPTKSQAKALTDALNCLNKKRITVYNLENVCRDFVRVCIYTPPHKNSLSANN